MAFGTNRRSGGTLAAPIAEVGRIHSANMKFSRIFFYVRCASPIGGVRIAGQIVLEQHKENKRISEVQKTICNASPIVTEIA